MKYSYNWLKELSETKKTPEEVREYLTMHSFEIEGLEKSQPDLAGVVIGKILEIKPHPNADRLQLTVVDVGREKLGIVCGAKNISVGDVVPVATVGTRLPNGLEIRSAEIRGEKSTGMLCAQDELGLGESHEGIMLLDKKASLGVSLAEYLQTDDWILEMKVLPDRSHDALSHIGMAREIAVLEGKKIDYDFDGLVLPKKKSKKLSVEIAPSKKKEDILCQHYIGAVMENIQIQESPQWMRARLQASGMRAINNVVDATNYVMLELGQPLHAFDFEKIAKKGEAKIIVRRAKKEEKITLLDEAGYVLGENNLVISNGKTPLALAGIMGGKDSGINEGTKRIVLEAANFAATNIRKTRTALGLRTDSSDRFEKGLDPNLAEKAMVRLIEILEHTAGGKLEGVVDVYPEKILPWKITLEEKYVNSLLGEKISEKEVVRILHLLGIKTRKRKFLECEIPTHRLDLQTAEDLIEEIGRVHGYAKIQARPVEGAILPAVVNQQVAFERELQNILLGLGFDEVYNYSFYGENELEKSGLSKEKELHWELLNPMNPGQKYVRISLLPNILKNVNENLKYFSEFGIFEIGKAYEKQGAVLQEKRYLILAKVLAEDRRAETFFTLKGEIETLLQELGAKEDLLWRNLEKTKNLPWNRERSFQIQSGENKLGVLGEVDRRVLDDFKIKSRVAVSIFDLQELRVFSRRLRKYQALNIFPMVTRDISFFVNQSIAYEEIITAIEKAGNELIMKVDFPFEPFEKNGKKSLTFRIILGSSHRTLENEEIEKTLQQIISNLENDLKLELRK